MAYKYNLSLTPNQVVLFADVIGFSNLVELNEKFETQNCNELQVDLKGIFNNIMETFDCYNEIKFNWISDSIIISANQEYINEVLEMIAQLTNKLLTVGLAFKGGISLGNLHNDGNIWGVPIVEAVGLEKQAVYPRIIILKSTLNKLKLDNKYKIYFVDMDDGFAYFDFFCYFLEQEDYYKNGYDAFLGSWSRAIETLMDTAKNDQHKSKWIWLSKRLCFAINKNSSQINKMHNEQIAKVKTSHSLSAEQYYDKLVELIGEQKWQN